MAFAAYQFRHAKHTIVPNIVAPTAAPARMRKLTLKMSTKLLADDTTPSHTRHNKAQLSCTHVQVILLIRQRLHWFRCPGCGARVGH